MSTREVKWEELRWRCDATEFAFESTAELKCCREIFGQDRALDAIRLGLEIDSPGYNIFVSGLTGTGRSTTIKQLLETMGGEAEPLSDLCYVYNFRTPEEPLCLTLPAGDGLRFKRRMHEVLATLREHIPKALDSDHFSSRQKEIVSEAKDIRSKTVEAFEAEVAEAGFQLHEVQYGPFTRPAIVALVEGEPVELDKLRERAAAGDFDQKQFDEIEKSHDELTSKMEEALKRTRELDREVAAKVASLEKETVRPIIDTCFDEVSDTFPQPEVRAYLYELRDNSVDDLESFRDDDESSDQSQFIGFDVNVIVENSRKDDTPVIIETAPTYRNIFGTIETPRKSARGDVPPDFMMIRAGSLLRANGGFLVLGLNDALDEPGVWTTLKRALKSSQVTIQPLETTTGPAPALKPRPIEIDLKVVLMGDSEAYQYLYSWDEDFRKIFKVKADFDSEMDNNIENRQRYAQFIRNLADEEDILPFHRSAVATIVEQGAQLAGRQDKLSTRFSDVADLVRESSYWARKSQADPVQSEHVDKAVAERVRRVDLPEQRMGEAFVDGTILIDTKGASLGQINGLSVYDVGDYSFGKPVRITAETSVGRAGITDIEREADLAGKTYNKGSYILEGYLRGRFSRERPMTMSASVGFEQSYGGIDGDSASSTEIYAILSSLSDLPLRQNLAVTGSVNQKGEIQPIGGVNQKVQGFYDLCHTRGLTGDQGVIIPDNNVIDLMLRPDIVDAVRDGEFYVHAIETIEDGVELLTGRVAGERADDGQYPQDSVYGRVDAKLALFADQLKEADADADAEKE